MWSIDEREAWSAWSRVGFDECVYFSVPISMLLTVLEGLPSPFAFPLRLKFSQASRRFAPSLPLYA